VRPRTLGLDAKPTSPLIFSGAVILAALIIVAVFNSYRGVPLPVAVLARLLAAPSCLTRHTPFGVRLYAIGNNREAARRAGVLVDIIKILAFAILGMLTTLGGVFAVAQVLGVPPASAQFDRRKPCLSGGSEKNRISETHERLPEGIPTRARIASSVAALSNPGWLVEPLAIVYRSVKKTCCIVGPPFARLPSGERFLERPRTLLPALHGRVCERLQNMMSK
jgi:Branched-chain amino acid transport system / permease component